MCQVKFILRNEEQIFPHQLWGNILLLHSSWLVFLDFKVPFYALLTDFHHKEHNSHLMHVFARDEKDNEMAVFLNS